jgi:beta-lactamase regulating signal transducer with metallopeptidase domain
MIVWMLWSIGATLLAYASAAALERAAASVALARRFVWIGAMGVAIALPLVWVALPAAVPGDVPIPVSPVPTSAPAAERDWTAPLQAALTTPRYSVAVARVNLWLGIIWPAASAVLLLSLVRAVLDLRRQRSRWREIELEGDTVHVSPDVGPAVVGFFRARIVLPEWALIFDLVQRELLLRHEREHIRARDMIVLLAAELACIAFPWNVGMWRMRRRLRRALEIDCDSRVIRSAGNAREYALMLIEVSERPASSLSFATSLFEPKSNLEARVDAMIAPRPRRPLLIALPFTVLALAVLGVAGWSPPPALTPQQAVTPRPLPGNTPPRYPEALRTSRVDGHVILTFRTNPGGSPDTASLRDLESSHPLFSAAVRRVAPSWRFDSAGEVRLLVRFMTLDTERRERAGLAPPRYATDIGPLEPLIVVAAVY